MSFFLVTEVLHPAAGGTERGIGPEFDHVPAAGSALANLTAGKQIRIGGRVEVGAERSSANVEPGAGIDHKSTGVPVIIDSTSQGVGVAGPETVQSVLPFTHGLRRPGSITDRPKGGKSGPVACGQQGGPQVRQRPVIGKTLREGRELYLAVFGEDMRFWRVSVSPRDRTGFRAGLPSGVQKNHVSFPYLAH